MKKATQLLSALLSVCLLATVGCQAAPAPGQSAQPAQERVKLKVYLLSEDENRLTLHQDYYEANVKTAFPDYDVEFELPGKSFDDKFKIYNSSGELPDIFWATSDLAITSGNSLDLTPYIKADGFMDRYINPSALIEYSDGKIYSVSAGTDSYYTSAMFYNKDIFEKEGVTVPTSYAEFVQLCKTLADKGYIPLSITTWAVQNWLLQELMVNEDPQYIQKLMSGEAKFTDPAYVSAAGKLKELVDAGAFPKDVATIEQEPHVELYTSGKAAMIYHPQWILPSIASVPNTDYFLVPSFSKDSDVLNGWGQAFGGFNVSAKTANPEAAVQVAEWLAEQDAIFFNDVQKNAVALDIGRPVPDMTPIVKSLYDNFNKDGVKVIPNFAFNYLSSAGKAELATNTGKLLTAQITPDQFCESMAKVYGNQ